MFYIAILSFSEQKSVNFLRNKSDVAWTMDLYIIWPNMMGVQQRNTFSIMMITILPMITVNSDGDDDDDGDDDECLPISPSRS